MDERKVNIKLKGSLHLIEKKKKRMKGKRMREKRENKGQRVPWHIREQIFEREFQTRAGTKGGAGGGKGKGKTTKE